MSHILFISRDATIPQNLREALTAPELRIVTRNNPIDAESALQRGAFDLAILYADTGENTLKSQLRSLREISKDLYIIVLAPEYSLGEEQAAFDLGADLYFSEPIPTKSLQRILTRHSQAESVTQATVTQTAAPNPSNGHSRSSSALHTLRDFSNILGFSLDYKAFTQHFILKLREHISFSRIGIFLETTAKQSLVKHKGSQHLECIASLGLPSDLIDCFQLSRDVGIGKTLNEHPRVLNIHELTNTPFENRNNSIQKEFGILGCHLAVPISDREGQIGVAVLNGPITGREYSEDELQLLYLLMEELGLAIRNSRLHAELGRHGALIENVLSSMSSGAIVVSEDLEILYANRAAKQFLQVETEETRTIDFAELPNKLASPVHRAVEKGEISDAFLIPGNQDNQVYQVSIFPFSHNEELALLPRPTMVILEDFTKIEANKQTALDDSKSEIIGLIAERFAHEIRNSLVPLTTHMQLIDKKIDQPKFQNSLKSALQKETGRIKRFSEQMLYLAQNSNPTISTVDIETVILSGFEAAKKQAKNNKVRLSLDELPDAVKIQGDPEGMAYAWEEILLNSIQADEGENSPIRVNMQQNDEGILRITIKDGGPGFTDELIEHATEPFYTLRNTGVGLGLSVAKKIIESHHGFIQLNKRNEDADWDIQIELPTYLHSKTHTP